MVDRHPIHLAAGPAAGAFALVVLFAGCNVQLEQKVIGEGNNPCEPNPCQQQGACDGWTGTCTVEGGAASCSDWKPTGEAPLGTDGAPLTTPLAYEVSETSCDGIDNDCDGLIDEGVVGDANSCPTAGACKGQSPTVGCVAGKWQCQWPTDIAHEASETLCDGVDNDCDGETDETATPGAFDCKFVGVCKGLPGPSCDSGSWNCHYDLAADYQDAETACDGKDNDCDGAIDADLAPESLAGGAACPDVGVCAGATTIVCAGGKPVCDTTKVVGHQSFETLCDGEDNDCDGKTDNYQGSAVALVDTDIAECEGTDKGVCSGAATSLIERTCVAAQWQCDYDKVPLYENPETICDGKDNNCDGETDNFSFLPNVKPCGQVGVCASGKALCDEGFWACDYAALADDGYEPFEMSCDGKDNDCDGETDESVSAAGDNACLAVGVCATSVAVTCSKGLPLCDYEAVAGYEASELTCDGKDNDCDGTTDEADDLDAANSGCVVGVCAGVAKPTCAGGVWQCSYAEVGDYEETELSCDGKDNDCDGKTDEDLGEPQSAGCLTKGVCGAASVSCTAGKLVCAYGADYQTSESWCDGKDNDCDGLTDKGACVAGQGCAVDADCAAGSCVDLLGATGKVCTIAAGQCAAVGSDGFTSYVNSGDASCATGESISACNAGKWAAPQACAKETPACFDGACQLCVPKAIGCNALVANEVVECSADGKTQAVVKTCDSGYRCASGGLCVADGDFDVSDGTGALQAVAVGLSNGGLAVAWTASDASVHVRILDGTGTPKGPSTVVSENFKAQAGERLAIAAVGAGFAVAWVATADGADVVVRFFGADGVPAGDAAVAHTFTTGDQVSVALAGSETAAVVAWSGDVEDGADYDIAMQRYDAAGQKLGGTVLVNDQAGLTDDPRAMSQTVPAVTFRADGAFAVAWTHQSFKQLKQRVRARMFNASGVALGGIVILGTPSLAHTAASLTFDGGNLAATWTISSESTGLDIALRYFSGDELTPNGATIILNTVTAGAQTDSRVASAVGGGLVVLWQSQDAAGSGSGSDVAARDVLASGQLDKETIVHSGGAGEQDLPSIAVFIDGRIVDVWRHRDNAGAAGVVRARFR